MEIRSFLGFCSDCVPWVPLSLMTANKKASKQSHQHIFVMYSRYSYSCKVTHLCSVGQTGETSRRILTHRWYWRSRSRSGPTTNINQNDALILQWRPSELLHHIATKRMKTTIDPCSQDKRHLFYLALVFLLWFSISNVFLLFVFLSLISYFSDPRFFFSNNEIIYYLSKRRKLNSSIVHAEKAGKKFSKICTVYLKGDRGEMDPAGDTDRDRRECLGLGDLLQKNLR